MFVSTEWLKRDNWCDVLVSQAYFNREDGGLGLYDAKVHGPAMQAAAAIGVHKHLPKAVQGSDVQRRRMGGLATNCHATALDMFSTSTAQLVSNFSHTLLQSQPTDTVAIADALRLAELVIEPLREAHSMFHSQAENPDPPPPPLQHGDGDDRQQVAAPAAPAAPATHSLALHSNNQKVQKILTKSASLKLVCAEFQNSNLTPDAKARMSSQSRPSMQHITTDAVMNSELTPITQTQVIYNKSSRQTHMDKRGHDGEARQDVHKSVVQVIGPALKRYVADHNNPIRIQEEKHRPKSVQSLEATNKKKTNKLRTDVSISIGATTNDIDVTFPFAMNNDGVQEAALASKEYYADRPAEACDVRMMRKPYLEAMDKAFLLAEKRKDSKYRHVPKKDPSTGYVVMFDPLPLGVDATVPHGSQRVMERVIGIVPSKKEHVAKIYPYIRASLFNAILPVARSRVYSYIHYNFTVDDAKPEMELRRAVAPSGAIKVDAGVKAKARQEAQKAKAQARKGSIPIGMVQQSYSRGAPVSASASSASAATVSSTETQYGWTATRNQILH
jgi:hypothetical protein